MRLDAKGDGRQPCGTIKNQSARPRIGVKCHLRGSVQRRQGVTRTDEVTTVRSVRQVETRLVWHYYFNALTLLHAWGCQPGCCCRCPEPPGTLIQARALTVASRRVNHLSTSFC